MRGQHQAPQLWVAASSMRILRQCCAGIGCCCLQAVFWASAAALFVPVLFHTTMPDRAPVEGEDKEHCGGATHSLSIKAVIGIFVTLHSQQHPSAAVPQPVTVAAVVCAPAVCAEVLSLSDRLLLDVGSVSGSAAGGNSAAQFTPDQGLLRRLTAEFNATSAGAAAAAAGAPDSIASPAAAATGDAKQLQMAGVVQLLAFCMFEVLIGMFWPSMMTLRAKYVPEQQRSTIINVFRIPLNLFVCLILWKVRLGSSFGPHRARQLGGPHA